MKRGKDRRNLGLPGKILPGFRVDEDEVDDEDEEAEDEYSPCDSSVKRKQLRLFEAQLRLADVLDDMMNCV